MAKRKYALDALSSIFNFKAIPRLIRTRFTRNSNSTMNSIEAWEAARKRDIETSGNKGLQTESYLKELGTTIIEIEVGEGHTSKRYYIHKDLLCSKIPFFDKMFNGGFAEASSGKAHLPEDDPDMFDVLCRWVYTDEFQLWEERADDLTYKTSQTILMYLFLDKLCIRELGDEMISHLMYTWIKSQIFPSMENLTTALARLPEHCNFRKCFLFCYHFLLNGLVISETTLEHWPTAAMSKILSDNPALALEYLEFLRNQPRGVIAQDPREMPFCTFHAHGGEIAECPFRSEEQATDATAGKDTVKTILIHQR